MRRDNSHRQNNDDQATVRNSVTGFYYQPPDSSPSLIIIRVPLYEIHMIINEIKSFYTTTKLLR